MDTAPLNRRDGHLYIEDLNVANTIAKHGDTTPIWLTSRSRIKENRDQIAIAYEPLGARIRFAVKANDLLAVLQVISEFGDGFDVVSGGEIYKVHRAFGDMSKTVFAGAAKTDEELRYALQMGVGLINVEAYDELMALNIIAGDMGLNPTVGLRVIPGVDAHTGNQISTGHVGSKFGMEIDEVARLLKSNEFPHLSIRGIHIHIGSQIPHPGPCVAAIEKVLPLIRENPQICTLDLGGGLPVGYRQDDHVVKPDAFAKAILQVLAEERELEILIEPGRSIVADACVLLTRVQTVKYSGGKRIVTVDAGMADIIRMAMYDAHHPIGVVVERDGPLEITDIAGPVCESSDFLGRDRMLPPLRRGDLLYVGLAGAYGSSMSSNYNGNRRGSEVMICGDQSYLVRRRETFDDLVVRDNLLSLRPK